MTEKKEFELKLSENKTFEIRDIFFNFYSGLDTIEKYFLERKYK